VLNEKRIIQRAGLADAQTLFDQTDVSDLREALADFLDVPAWR
jgi:hypothetical protein